jgi:hypothetical protein
MSNRAFWKAMHLLCSPFSLAAMVLLLVNDHLLRHLWPSWWTGKLGDFAWLLFFPFALAVVLSLLIPPRVRRQERIVRWLTFGLTGGMFALAKTLPVFHDLLARGLGRVLGVPITLIRDPTDLIALVSLGVGWWLWEQLSNPTPPRAAPGWIVLSLATVLTIANSMVSYGIIGLELCSDDQQTFVYALDFCSTLTTESPRVG